MKEEKRRGKYKKKKFDEGWGRAENRKERERGVTKW